MIEFAIFGLFYVILALITLYRIIIGPSVVDRTVASGSLEVLATVALVLYALYSGRGIYLDIAMIVAMLAFIGTLLIAKYLEEDKL